jgi:hypothetical protein
VASKQRKTKPTVDDLLGRAEQLAEQLLDLSAEERRLLKTLARVRTVRAALITALATVAGTIRDTER